MLQVRNQYKLPLWRRMTWRAGVTLAAAGFVLLYPVYDLIDQAVTHGISQRGDLLVVNMKAMSNFNLDQANGNTSDIPLPYRQLDGKRVMLAGEMYAPTSAGGPLDQFQLVYSINSCCFNGPPRIQHFVKATVEPGRQIDYVQGVVNVVGTLHVGVEKSGGQIDSVYRLDVEKVEE